MKNYRGQELTTFESHTTQEKPLIGKDIFLYAIPMADTIILQFSLVEKMLMQFFTPPPSEMDMV